MSSVARAHIMGHLGADPEVRLLEEGRAVTTFRVAASKRWTDKHGRKAERTSWFRVTCFNKLADICGQHLKKGAHVSVDGELEVRAYTDKQGQKREATEVVARDVHFLSKKGTAQADDLGYDEPGATDDPF